MNILNISETKNMNATADSLYYTDFHRAYMDAAEFTDCGPDSECRGHEWSDGLMGELAAHCEIFWRANCNAIMMAYGQTEKPEPRHGWAAQAGQDLWLTRNRHGAGFWDGDWPYEIGKFLTEMAHLEGSYNLYLGDDGMVRGFDG